MTDFSAPPPRAVPPWCADLTNGTLADSIPTSTLVGLLLHRYATQRGLETNREMLELGARLVDGLNACLDTPWNRFSTACYNEVIQGLIPYYLRHATPVLENPVVVDVGCGSWNPLAGSFLLLGLGASKAYAFDVDPVESPERAARALADLAGKLFVDHQAICPGFDISRADIAKNLSRFDLAALQRGELESIDRELLHYEVRTAEGLPLEDGEAHLVSSNAVLEHVLEVEQILRELARITAVGGIGNHVIDASDHRRYNSSDYGPLTYLEEPGDDAIVSITAEGTPFHYEMNRLRPREFLPIFESVGFEVVSYEVYESHELSDEEHESFCPRYRDMPREHVAEVIARVCVRKLESAPEPASTETSDTD